MFQNDIIKKIVSSVDSRQINFLSCAAFKYLKPNHYPVLGTDAAQEKLNEREKYLRSLLVRVIAFFVRRKSQCRNVGHTHVPPFLISARWMSIQFEIVSSPLAYSRENNASTHLLDYGCFPSTLWRRHTGRKHKRDKCCLRCRPSSAWLPAEDKVHWSRVAKWGIKCNDECSRRAPALEQEWLLTHKQSHTQASRQIESCDESTKRSKKTNRAQEKMHHASCGDLRTW